MLYLSAVADGVSVISSAPAMQYQDFLFKRMYLLRNGAWMGDGAAKQDYEYWDACCTRRLLQLLIYPALQKAQGGHSASSCSHLLSCQLCTRLKPKDAHEAPALSPLRAQYFPKWQNILLYSSQATGVKTASHSFRYDSPERHREREHLPARSMKSLKVR